jgi:hypothetical protein
MHTPSDACVERDHTPQGVDAPSRGVRTEAVSGMGPLGFEPRSLPFASLTSRSLLQILG